MFFSLFTGSISHRNSCFFGSGLRPSTASNRDGSECRKWARDTTTGEPMRNKYWKYFFLNYIKFVQLYHNIDFFDGYLTSRTFAHVEYAIRHTRCTSAITSVLRNRVVECINGQRISMPNHAIFYLKFKKNKLKLNL